MKQVNSREYIHPWYLLLITFWTLLFLLINRNLFWDLPLVIVVFYFYFKNGLKLSSLRRLLIYAALFSMSFLLLNLLYPAKGLRSGEFYQYFQIIIYKSALQKSINTAVRLFLVSVVSMSSGAVIKYSRVVLHLIVHKGLKLFWGYPILLAMNSIALFKVEFERIRINAKLRQLSWRERLSLFFPLLVFAIRHSQRGALSLVTRGLNHEKSFYYTYALNSEDRLRFVLFCFIYFLSVGIAIFFR